MSRTAKALFAGSVLFCGASIWGVHMIQTMFAGVIRDEERLAAKRAQKERQLEFEDQARKRAYLEQVQSVSQASVPPPDVKGEVPKSADGLDFGCKTCER
ncbi:hypothetical protein NBRC10512v2_002701 [Rhodotorula toruloides]